jgi:sugar phosphate isomerase/epimerase
LKFNTTSDSRREVLFGLAGGALSFRRVQARDYHPEFASHTSIWVKEAEFRRRRLADIIDDAFDTIDRAGYRRVELVSQFLSPGLCDRTLARLEKRRLEASIVSSCGPLYDVVAAARTRSEVSKTAALMKGRGTRFIDFRPEPKRNDEPKTAEEVRIQADQLDRMGAELLETGSRLLLNHEVSEMRDEAREWRYSVAHTDPMLVSLCLDLEATVRAGMNPWQLMSEAGPRLRSLHLLNSQNGVELESLRGGDINMKEITVLLRDMMYHGYLVVELVPVCGQRILLDDLSSSFRYLQRVFDAPVSS